MDIRLKMWQTVKDNFSLKGLAMVVVILFPSILLTLFPPIDYAPVSSSLTLTVLENVGRIAVIAILLFSARSFDRRLDIWFVLASIFAALYYAGWFRYFFTGQTHELLYRPLFAVPVPLAVFPVLALAFLAIWTRNIALALALLIMAVGHIPSSFSIYREVA